MVSYHIRAGKLVTKNYKIIFKIWKNKQLHSEEWALKKRGCKLVTNYCKNKHTQ
jgi:hypothetical protein